ncbi:hypothetical protein C0992_009465, partial [Termitomyces sp. T32_za158]
MEVLQVNGYVAEQKAVIAERYLAPQAREASELAWLTRYHNRSNPSEDDPKITTTQQRKPLPILDTVHICITPETLKDYVGLAIYQKNRMPPPPGVSTDLGYLGNGSGAVMPVEAMSMICKGGLQLTGNIRECPDRIELMKGRAFELGITTGA